jgi:hypothetical protein
MARVTRKTQKIFALGAANNGQFGSAVAGTYVLSTDPAVLQNLAAWNSGWLSATVGAKFFPTLEEMQGIQYVQTYQLAYMFQEGIPEYDSGTTYYTNSVVKKAGTYQLYGSITNGNIGNALTDAANWVFLSDLSAPFPGTLLIAQATDTGAANTYQVAPSPAIGSYVTGQIYFLIPAHDNTGASTISISALAAKSIKLTDGTDPAAGQLKTGIPCCMVYNGTNFIALTPRPVPAITTVGNFKITCYQIAGSYTFTPQATCVKAKVTVIGGGGGSVVSNTGGGGAGGGAQGIVAKATMTPNVSVTVGAKGGIANVDGGTTSFGAIMSATGGQSSQHGRAGGSGTGGDFQWVGNNGVGGDSGNGGAGFMGFGLGAAFAFTGTDGAVIIEEYLSS